MRRNKIVFGIFAICFLLTSCSANSSNSYIQESSLSGANSTLSAPSQNNSQHLEQPSQYENKGAAAYPALNEEQFTTYMYKFSRFINQPFTLPEDIKSLDLFYLLVEVAQDYATWQGKTYADPNGGELEYRFPLADLKKLSNTTLGFEFDFEPYKDNRYFEKNAYPADYFDEDTQEFFIMLVEPHSIAKDSKFFYSLNELTDFEIVDDELFVKCE